MDKNDLKELIKMGLTETGYSNGTPSDEFHINLLELAFSLPLTCTFLLSMFLSQFDIQGIYDSKLNNSTDIDN